MRKVVFVLLGLLSFELGATGIGPPAGMGTLLLIMAVASILMVLFVSWLAWKLYKKSRNKKRYLFFLSGSVVLVVFLSSVGIRIDRYDFIDNNPLESAVEIVDNKDGYYLQLSDGGWYKFTKKYHKNPISAVAARLSPGKKVMLEPKGDGQQFTLSSIGDTHTYYWYKREQDEHLIVIPLRFTELNKYEQKFEGSVTELNLDWQADATDLVRALTKNDCCDVPWIQELLSRGANRDDVINQKQLLHRFFDHTDRASRMKYRTVVTQLLLDAGADINSIQDYSGSSVLHKVINKMPAHNKAMLSAVDEAFLRLLLDRGADPNISYYSGVTPLEGAVRRRQYEVAMLLLDYGANPNLRVDNNGTAFQLAQSALKRQQKSTPTEADPVLQNLVAMMEAGQ